MSILSWGKGLLETTPSIDGAPASNADWTAIDTPKSDTLKVTATAGSETTAQEEGGDIVDSRISKTTYQLEWDNFVKKGVDLPFEDNDGIISGEHAFRYTPEDETTEGFLIERSTVHAEESYSTADGKLVHYVAKCLKPKTGKTIKPYTKTAG
jgi:hypothetical protein